MALLATQICNWNDIASEVAAGTMSWNGTAQSGTNDIRWSDFIVHVNYDGTNPAGIASTQCPNYNQIIARVTTLQVPTSVVALSSSHSHMGGSWAAPAGGLAPTSYDYQLFDNGVAVTGVINIGASPAPSTAGFVAGDTGTIAVRARNGAQAGPWATATVTII